MKYVKVLLPIFFLLATELLLFLTNFQPHTSLYGWDTILPELNFSQNFLSQIFGVWQQNKALGFYDGMVTMSNLPHTFFLWLLSFVFPTNFLRYFFIFFMHFLGMVGMYVLLQNLFRKTWISCTAALFYGLNFATIQLFYAPLEVFAVHFAALPFLTYTLLSFLKNPTKKSLVFFALASIFSLPQAFVPQIFMSYLLLLFMILGTYLFVRRTSGIKAVGIILLTVFCINAYWLLPYMYGVPQNAPVILNSKINQTASTSIYLMNQARGGFFDTILLRGFMLDTTEFIPQKGQAYIMPEWRNYTNSPFFLIPSFLFALLCFWGIFQTIKSRQKGLYPFLIVFCVCFFFLGNTIVGLSTLNAVLRFLLPIFNEAFRFPFTKFSTLFVFTYSIFLGYGIYTLISIMKKGVTSPHQVSIQNGPRISDQVNQRQTKQTAGRNTFFADRILPLKRLILEQLRSKKNGIPTSAFIFFRQISSQCQRVYSHFPGELKVGKPTFNFFIIYSAANFHLGKIGRYLTKKSLIAERLLKLSRQVDLLLPLFSCAIIAGIFLSSFPAFQGNFLYSMLRLPFPKDYQQTISFFQNQNPNARSAILPEASFWNWQYHSDGYRGSGFLWYGLPQAVMDRSFDPWSTASEQYYWELSQAIYSQNPALLKSVFEKYQISYALLDLKKIYPYAPQSAEINETKTLLQKAGLTQIKQFGDEHIYFLPHQEMVSLATNLPLVQPFQWTQEDMFYFLHDTYISSTPSDFSLPFSSLFTQKKDTEFTLSQTPNTILFTSFLPKNMSHLLIPAYAQTQQVVPGALILKKQTNGSFLLESVIQTPTVYAGNQKIYGQNYAFPLFSLTSNVILPITVNINGSREATIQKFTDQTLTTTLFTLKNDNLITLSNKNNGAVTTAIPLSNLLSHIPPATSLTFSPTQTPIVFRVSVPKVTDPLFSFTPNVTTGAVSDCSPITKGTFSSQKMPSGLTLTSNNTDACISYFDQHAFTGSGYAAFVQTSRAAGQPLSFWAENTTEHYAFSQVSFPPDKTATTSSLILPPLQPNNLGYGFHFDNTSINTPTINSLHSFSLYPVPYTFLATIQADAQPIHTQPTIESVSFDHLNPSLYLATIPPNQTGTLILSAAYNPGWGAYAFASQPNFLDIALPFLFGTPLPHVEVNNWENGWNLDQSSIINHQSSIIIVFLPQYLEYLGFGIVLGFVFFLIFYLRKNRNFI